MGSRQRSPGIMYVLYPIQQSPLWQLDRKHGRSKCSVAVSKRRLPGVSRVTVLDVSKITEEDALVCVPPQQQQSVGSAFEGAVGSSTTCQGTQEEYCPPVIWLIGKETSVPAVDSAVGHEPAAVGSSGESVVDNHSWVRKSMWILRGPAEKFQQHTV